MRIEHYIDSLIKKAIPFAILRPPGHAPLLVIQSDSQSNQNTTLNDGFNFYPFSSREKLEAVNIRADYVIDLSSDQNYPELENISSKLSIISEQNEESIVDKETYVEIIQRGVQLIKQKEISKIVLSRIIAKELKSINYWSIFEKLGKKYSMACIYLVNIPGKSVWFGASPEKLVDYSNGQYQTIALAGTLPSEKDLKWSSKEIDEHAVVANYISDCMVRRGIPFQKDEVYTKDLGLISHLAQDFYFRIENEKDLEALTQEFHPGPAISGYPKEKAIEFIYELEAHNREYYTGYFAYQLGNLKSSWINIRCAKYSDKNLYVYVGGGIMQDSNPEKEWTETELKSKAILDIIKE